MLNKHLDKLLAAIDPSIDTIIQAGVGYGNEVPRLRERFPHARLFGFEPCRQFLKYWLDAGYPGVLLPFALAGSPGMRTLYLRGGRAEASSFYPRANETKADSVLAVTLDDMFGAALPGRMCLLWMDCEGAELDALRGGAALLKMAVRYCLIEVADNNLMQPAAVKAGQQYCEWVQEAVGVVKCKKCDQLVHTIYPPERVHAECRGRRLHMASGGDRIGRPSSWEVKDFLVKSGFRLRKAITKNDLLYERI